MPFRINAQYLVGYDEEIAKTVVDLTVVRTKCSLTLFSCVSCPKILVANPRSIIANRPGRRPRRAPRRSAEFLGAWLG